MVKYSIHVPVFNVEKYLPKCIDSILGQTYKNFELILIDDGSTDNSGEICDYYKYLDNRVRVFHQKNRGTFYTRSKAIKYAKGEYSLFVDSDDYIEPNTLIEIDSIVADYNPDVILFDYYKFSDNKKEKISQLPDGFSVGLLTASDAIEIVNTFLCSSRINSLWNKAFRTSTICFSSPYDEMNIVYGEDALFLSIVFQYAESYYYLKQNLYYYRDNAQGMSHQNTMKRIKNFEYSWNALHTLRINCGICDDETMICMAKRLVRGFIDCGMTIQNSNLTLLEKKTQLHELKNQMFYQEYSEFVRNDILTKKQSLFWFFLQNKMYYACLLLCSMMTKRNELFHT